MPKNEVRYHVRFNGLEITKFDPETGKETAFNNIGPVDWSNMKYDGVIIIQSALIGILDELKQRGIETAKEKSEKRNRDDSGE